jgi:hypothetical protein
MKSRALPLASLLLFFGLENTPSLRDDARADNLNTKEVKDKKGVKHPVKAPISQYLVQSVDQLIKAKDALKAAIQKEALEKHLQPGVIKQLRQAIDEVEKGIRHAETANKKNK